MGLERALPWDLLVSSPVESLVQTLHRVGQPQIQPRFDALKICGSDFATPLRSRGVRGWSAYTVRGGQGTPWPEVAIKGRTGRLTAPGTPSVPKYGRTSSPPPRRPGRYSSLPKSRPRVGSRDSLALADGA
jgi:hypothetical protein